MGKVLQSKRLKKRSTTQKERRRFFLTLDELYSEIPSIYSEIPSISLVKGCSDQREILSDATDKNFN